MTRHSLPERETLAECDRVDPLAPRRELFELPAGVLYFDGNSLGPLTRHARRRLREAVERDWGEGLIRSWNEHDWIDLPRRTAAKIAPLLGAEPDEVMVADSTSVNLFKALAAALALRPERRVIVAEREQFPTDLYMIQGLVDWLGPEAERRYEVRVVPTAELETALGDEVAVLCSSHVQFQHGKLLDMGRLSRAAHDAGALAVWDLSHSAGAMEVDLDSDGADFAVGCGYKFLNGGPGAPAYVYVARRHHRTARSPLAGWFGHEAPFAFDLDYRPAPGVERFLCGTPPILSLIALDAALDAFAGVDMVQVRRKSIELGELFITLAEARLAEWGVEVACPRDASQRGSQVSLAHPEGYAVAQAAIERGLIPDFRPPDILRVGLTPLYQSRVEVFDAGEILHGVLAERAWDAPRYQRRQKVT